MSEILSAFTWPFAIPTIVGVVLVLAGLFAVVHKKDIGIGAMTVLVVGAVLSGASVLQSVTTDKDGNLQVVFREAVQQSVADIGSLQKQMLELREHVERLQATNKQLAAAVAKVSENTPSVMSPSTSGEPVIPPHWLPQIEFDQTFTAQQKDLEQSIRRNELLAERLMQLDTGQIPQ